MDYRGGTQRYKDSLKKESLKILLNKIKPINFQNITKKFGSLDLDNNGEISV
jgi:hypothetical protein